MAGAFRTKTVYRLAGVATGAAVTLFLAPNLQNSPILLVICLALWIGFCIYLAVLDRTPRAFLFQMAAFSSAITSFPYLDDPSDIFTSTVSRVEEMTLAILCVTIAHTVLKPTNVRLLIHKRTVRFSKMPADGQPKRSARITPDSDTNIVASWLPMSRNSA